MSQTSPAATGAAGAVIAALVAVISAASKHFGAELSAQDQVSLAGGIAVAAHWAAQQYAARAALQKTATNT